MAALTDLSDLINRQTGGSGGSPENVFFFKLPRIGSSAAAAVVAGRDCSLWQYEGQPSGGAVPTVAEIPSRETVGAIPFAAPAAGREKFLISSGICSNVTGTFLLYDRLFHIGGLNATLTTDQEIQGSLALTRNTSGGGNAPFYEIYSQIGATSTTLTMVYTNQAGTSGRTSTVNIGGSGFREATRIQRIPLATGDTGIRVIERISLAGSTGTAGNFGITVVQPLSWLPVIFGGVAGWRDYTTGLPGIPVISPNACLSLLFRPSITTSPDLFGGLAFVEK